ncbi:MAG: hypothetical protein ACI83I_000168 [Bacteroidia bacterium]
MKNVRHKAPKGYPATPRVGSTMPVPDHKWLVGEKAANPIGPEGSTTNPAWRSSINNGLNGRAPITHDIYSSARKGPVPLVTGASTLLLVTITAEMFAVTNTVSISVAGGLPIVGPAQVTANVRGVQGAQPAYQNYSANVVRGGNLNSTITVSVPDAQTVATLVAAGLALPPFNTQVDDFDFNVIIIAPIPQLSEK